jgi:hypothetical protein
MDGFLHRVKGLDAFPKVNEDFYKRTLSGGVVTLVSALIMMLLFISETSKRLSPPRPAGRNGSPTHAPEIRQLLG